MSISEQELFWQQVENGSPEVYGSWARANPDCLRWSKTTATPVLILQLCMSVVSICQVIFMISRAPKVPWEAIYLPLTEAVTYALAYTDHGTFRLASGKLFPWSRMGSWVCTCPIMLGMISNMALVKYKSQPLNPLMVAASLLRLVFGISATLTPGDGPETWLFFFIAVIFFTFEYVTVYCIFAMTIADFASIGSPLANAVIGRLNILRGVFYFSWTAFPIIWLVSYTNACLISEDVSATLYLFADAVCKNSYGIILWQTTWGLLNGKWDREYAHNRDVDGTLIDANGAKAPQPQENFDIKFFGQTVASVRRSQRRPRADVRAQDEQDVRDSRRRKNRKGDRRDDRRKRRDYSSEDDSENSSRRSSSDDDSDGHYRRRRRNRRGKKGKSADSLSEGDLDHNIAKIMEAMKRNSEEALRIEQLEHQQQTETKKLDSMC